MSQPARGNWNSRFGFVLAAAGSAIGLGNIWRFPYTAGQNGGGAFVLVYLIFVVMIGVPVLLSELAVGRSTGKNAVGAFKKLVPGSSWPLLGGLGVLTGFGILSFYSVIAGLTLGYLYLVLTGSFPSGLQAEQSAAIFTQMSSNPAWVVGLCAVFLCLTAAVVSGGISSGIERSAKILMPTFLVFLVVLAIRSVTLEGAGEGLRFLFQPDFSKLTGDAVMSALGQALFSLSIGMGAMITYGSYLQRKENVPASAASVAFFDTSIAILAGVIIFPAVFASGAEPSGGAGLVFVVMPTIFDTMPLGGLFAILFYALLAIAALTSTISLLEVIVAYFVDEKGWARKKAAWSLAAVCFVVAIPSALSLGANAYLTGLLGGKGFLEIFNRAFGTYSLSIGAFCLCIFISFRWGIPAALAEIEDGGKLPAAGLWAFLVRFVCPLAVAVTLLYAVVTGNYL